MNLTEKIFAAGVVGCGGAGFPTHKKICGTVEHFIVNAVECEPLLCTDKTIISHHADRLVATVVKIGKFLSAKKMTIATKRAYTAQVEALEKAIKSQKAKVELHLLDSFYPAGDEQVLVHEVTGCTVPPAGIPLMVGAVVDNAATVLAIADAIEDKPLTHKYLTVSGEVGAPKVLHVPVGTSFAKCIELAGGALLDDYFVVAGGPMMGKGMTREQAMTEVVTKTTSGILVLPPDGPHANTFNLSVEKMLNRAKSACIQCTYCSSMCPRALMGHPLQPHKIMRKMAMAPVSEMLDDPDILNAALCCECGICEIYACPMGLNPRKVNSLIKGELAKAHIRYAGFKGELADDPERESRKVPSRRAATRAGVAKYYDYKITDLVEYEPDRVEVPVKMHIGAPSVAVVNAGDRVKVGQLIAQCPENALGAQIHASIDGVVKEVGARIVIEKESR